jgi:hypothetical protein
MSKGILYYAKVVEKTKCDNQHVVFATKAQKHEESLRV